MMYRNGCVVMFCVLDYDDEKWVCGIRKNALQLSRNQSDALLFSDLSVAEAFVSVLRFLYPDVYFRAFPFSE